MRYFVGGGVAFVASITESYIWRSYGMHPCPMVVMGIGLAFLFFLARFLSGRCESGRLEVSRLQRTIKHNDQFVSMAAHELRGPLSAMKITVEVYRARLLRGEVPKEQALHLIDKIGRGIKRQSALIDLLLDVSLLADNRLTLTLKSVNLSSLVAGIVEHFEEEAREAGCAIELQVEPQIVITCDPTRIEEVVVNLLSNAIKYGRGAPVQIYLAGGRMVELRVSDHGIGIAAEDHDRIFQRFERAGADSSYSGLGLGLWISRGIVELHHGEIQVFSEFGKGSTFVVRIPEAP